MLGGVLSVVIFFEGCSEDIMYFFSFLSLLSTLFLYMRSCDHL